MKRYAFVDWYRGLACILMFQTHAFDSWLLASDKHTAFYGASQHLGGFPARIFLLLAGVSLMMRFDSDRRRQVPEAQARKGAALRGLEVLGLGYAFRFTEWILGLPSFRYVENILRVDVLNCIGMSLILSAYVASPRDLDENKPRLPWRPALLALVMLLCTPMVERFAQGPFPPRFLTSYIAGPKPMAFFPLFPWMAYTLTGCVVGTAWIRAIRAGLGGPMMGITFALGLLMAVGGQFANHASFSLYHFGALSNVLTSPVAYLYRTGVCLALAGLSYWATLLLPAGWFSPLRQLGRTSLLVYWVHIELVYGHLSDPIKRRLGPLSASLLLCVLTALMVALSYWRTERYGRRPTIA